MNDRKFKGMQIARTQQIRKTERGYIVPSQNGHGTYLVTEDRLFPNIKICTCPDYELRKQPCKHIFAVQCFITKEVDSEGNITVTQIKRITYAQEWSAYNKAQTSELKLFDELLKDLLESVPESIQKMGRPRLPLREQLFCSIIKVYSQLSSRRASMLYAYATDRGFIAHKPYFNVVSTLLNREDITPILLEFVKKTALPLSTVETDFAVDSSGFRTTSFNVYCKEKHKTTQTHKWLKAHICIGTKTNVVTSVVVSDEHVNDSPQFIPLVNATVDAGFAVHEVSADKAYNSTDNYNVVDSIGGVAYIPYKSNTTATVGRTGNKGRLWRKMFHYFKLNQDEFYEHYHKRSNVETTFSAIKKKLGETIKSKNRTAQVNELLCKIIAYNITVLIQEIHELGIEPKFVF
ncbi:MAG: transposase [Candidatus Micrarchaeota archaeon]|nr:transposase [Candidatus Micrarchaeota archaeon]MDE1834418.1 transposase [Candidatus Micrarchaeota archaeon]MDE1859467.1 transposase [Candidatus Micrarchaeota archaeon]